MKPSFPVQITTLNKKSVNVNAVFDSGSFYTIIREDKLPKRTTVLPEKITFRTANKEGSLTILGHTILTISIGKKMIQESVMVSNELGSDMLIGAKSMQSWDISILNSNCKTKISVAHDMRDPEITEVD
jgi:hypothetical protein